MDFNLFSRLFGNSFSLVLVALWTLLPQIAFGQTAELPSTIVTTSHDVVDAYDGVISLREAIAYAKDGDTVTFASHLQDARIVLKGTELAINKNVSIVATGQNVIVDGNLQSLVFHIGSDRTVILAGLTVTGSNGRSSNVWGGGISNNGNLTVNHCTITGNSSESCSGISNTGVLSIMNSTITGNTTLDKLTGAIHHSGSSLTITNSSISENSGIGIFSYGSWTIADSTVSKNSDWGIQHIADTSSCTITNCTFDSDSIYCSAGINSVTNELLVISSTISGGSIMSAGRATLINSAIFGSQGTGVRFNRALTAINCTIAQNGDGGISNWSDDSSTATLYNTIVANNKFLGTPLDISTSGGNFAGSNNFIGAQMGSVFINNQNGNIVGTWESPIDPKFVNTQGDDWRNWDLRLVEGSNSLAFNRGNNDYVPAWLTLDLAGNFRIRQGTVDIGAYESNSELYTPPTPKDPLTKDPNFLTEY